VTYCDIYSGWTANRAVWNKGAAGVVAVTREVEGMLPFELLGFDTDNGSEFLNWHLLRYFQERPKAVGFTRSRPYKKGCERSCIERFIPVVLRTPCIAHSMQAEPPNNRCHDF
jgi:hypothetical protein